MEPSTNPVISEGWVANLFKSNGTVVLVIGGVILLHVVVILCLVSTMWTQAPKQQRMARRFNEEGKQD